MLNNKNKGLPEKNLRSKFSSGFTLIELLVVIAIIGMLASTVLVSLGSARSKARDAKRTSDLQNISLALVMYSDANKGLVPPSLAALVPTYLQTEPKDPLGTSYLYKTLLGTADCSGDKCNVYKLGAFFENQAPILDSSCSFDGNNGSLKANCSSIDNTKDNGATYCMAMTNLNSLCKSVSTTP
jgi:prepilin-type N-terminal cleavage/methylation domain-containing protein